MVLEYPGLIVKKVNNLLSHSGLNCLSFLQAPLISYSRTHYSGNLSLCLPYYGKSIFFL